MLNILLFSFKVTVFKLLASFKFHLIYTHRKLVFLLKSHVLSTLSNSSYTDIPNLTGKHQFLDQSAKYRTNIQVNWDHILSWLLLWPWMIPLLHSARFHPSAIGSHIAHSSLTFARHCKYKTPPKCILLDICVRRDYLIRKIVGVYNNLQTQAMVYWGFWESHCL